MGTNKLSIENSNSILLIAPFGMNCTLRYAYQRSKNHCPGCRVESNTKNISCINCRIKNFILNENKRWACRICGVSICVHKGGCLNCSN